MVRFPFKRNAVSCVNGVCPFTVILQQKCFKSTAAVPAAPATTTDCTLKIKKANFDMGSNFSYTSSPVHGSCKGVASGKAKAKAKANEKLKQPTTTRNTKKRMNKKKKQSNFMHRLIFIRA